MAGRLNRPSASVLAAGRVCSHSGSSIEDAGALADRRPRPSTEYHSGTTSAPATGWPPAVTRPARGAVSASTTRRPVISDAAPRPNQDHPTRPAASRANTRRDTFSPAPGTFTVPAALATTGVGSFSSSPGSA